MTTSVPVRTRLRSARRTLRRTVLGRRRLLAALLAGVAVAAALRATLPAPPPTVPVLVARHDLAAGIVVGRADVRTAAYAPGSQPEGLAEEVVGRTLAAPLRAGEPITDLRLVTPALANGYPGLVAIPVRLPDPGAVGLLAAGDRIDVYAIAPRAREARLVVSQASVIAVPAATAPAETGALTGRIVVLGVPAPSVAALAHASVGEFLSFAFSR